jgi:hypothetical protein
MIALIVDAALNRVAASLPFPVERRDVVLRDRPPMCVPIARAGPALNAGKSPSMRGRYRWMRYSTLPTVRKGSDSGSHASPFLMSSGTRSSAPDNIKTSDSSASWYGGRPLSVLRVIEGRDGVQPTPNGQLPAPESWESDSCGPKPERAGLVAMGTVIEAVPVSGFAANFSPMPRMAPLPLGREIAGKGLALGVAVGCCALASFVGLRGF